MGTRILICNPVDAVVPCCAAPILERDGTIHVVATFDKEGQQPLQITRYRYTRDIGWVRSPALASRSLLPNCGGG